MKMKQATTIFFLMMLSACAGSYKEFKYEDSRLPDIQKAELATALRELEGEYVVIDSRNDDNREYTTLNVIAGKESMVARLSGKKGYDLWTKGSNCIGHSKSEGNQFKVSCDGSSEVNYFSFEKLNAERKVTSGALIGGFKPLIVESKNYLFSFWTVRSGRPHHYVLTKK